MYRVAINRCPAAANCAPGFLLPLREEERMTTPKGTGLALKQLAELSQTTTADIQDMLSDHSEPKAVGAFKHRRFDFADALEIEIARQMSDKAGLPINEAFRLSVYAT